VVDIDFGHLELFVYSKKQKEMIIVMPFTD